ncbi:MAG: alpha/beta hydrolase [Pseudomonadota bacterium]
MSWLQRLGLWVDTRGGRGRQRRFREGWSAQTSEEIGFFNTPSVQYRYRERLSARPDAPTIVLTADPPVTLEAYDALLDIFDQAFRVVVVELPAMGFSATRTGFTFGFRDTNDDLARFLKGVVGTPAILAFSCVAGLAAIDIASRRPELASHVVVMQTGDVAAFDRWKAARDPHGILRKPVAGQVMMKRLARKRMPDWYRLAVGRQDAVPPLCACAAESFEHGALWSLASAYQVYVNPNNELGPVKQPLLALWGRADGSHPAEHERSALSFAEHAQLIAFDDLGHFSELEDPERVFAAIQGFVDSQPLRD